MFYCDDCKEKKDWYFSIMKSKGKCEVCGEIKLCNNVPSSQLPKSKGDDQ